MRFCFCFFYQGRKVRNCFRNVSYSEHCIVPFLLLSCYSAAEIISIPLFNFHILPLVCISYGMFHILAPLYISYGKTLCEVSRTEEDFLAIHVWMVVSAAPWEGQERVSGHF